MDQRWLEKDVLDIPDELNCFHPLIAQLLLQRGIATNQEADQYLEPQYDRDCADPFLFDDMAAAVDRIGRALLTEESIALYNDYDADGLCAGALLYETLSALKAQVSAVMNHREKDGYGLKKEIINTLAQRGVSLIITTDCGISNSQEILHAQECGIDVIITDHHTVPSRSEDIPRACAIIHPLVRADRYPFKHLAGGGSAFKLAQALIRTDHPVLVERRADARESSGSSLNWEGFEKWLLDFVCISTIGDCVPLKGENRMLVHYGLQVLGKTRRPGLRELLTRSCTRSPELTARTVSFGIAPRLNAASRMAHAQHAFDLLTTHNEQRAHELSDLLETLNGQRQRVTEIMYRQARAQLDEPYEQNKRILVGSSHDWPLGILGLVAGKLCNYYRRPVILVTQGEECMSGAARSIEGFHLAQAFEKMNHLFDRYGGHSAAGGFSLKQTTTMSTLRSTFEQMGEEWQNHDTTTPTHTSHGRIKIDDISLDVINALKGFAPFGQDNPYPRFTLAAVSIHSLKKVGATESHVRMEFEQGNKRTWAIAFNQQSLAQNFKVGERVDVLCELDSQEWQGRIRPEVRIIDMVHL